MMIRIAPLALLLLGLSLPPAVAQGGGEAAPPAAAPAPQPVQPQRFRSPEEGFAAFAEAVARHDERRLLRVLGEAGRRLIRSGDAVADRAARADFTAMYAAGHRIERPSADRAVLVVGPDDWPLPIPMRLSGGAWRFDARAGAQELVDRRIGRNELDTIETLRAIADAQRDYASGPGRQGGLRAYAQRFFSTPGQRDGLYWPSAPGEAESPLGPLLAAASAGGYARGRGDVPQAYHGYYFRILTRQGAAAPGGAMDWVVNGRMIGGFAVLAWPASYGSTGWKSFMVSHDSVVWEADLGRDTARRAAAITAFDPGQGWSRVAE
ncbi:DUF2950 domain-containing protein [Roseomonas sp. AR75]|uniref:DUF2950 domain-containing protein n=1 Tax=Roseomonas sp. AR75 TaxID=2562311 RepID=UPI001F0E6FBC|nr:DUF2950 domain-containing protein [Roseomonas sp. AR75]